jgi:hypothetical protein
MKPRFKTEKGNMIFLNIGKMISMLLHNFVLGTITVWTLNRFHWSTETVMLFILGANIGLLLGYLLFKGIVSRKQAMWVFRLSGFVCLLIIVFMNLKDTIPFILLGLFFGVANYAITKYHFTDLEKEIRDYFTEKDPSRYAIFKLDINE